MSKSAYRNFVIRNRGANNSTDTVGSRTRCTHYIKRRFTKSYKIL